MKSRLAVPCPDHANDACNVLAVKARCGDVRDANGTKVQSDGWTLSFVRRATIHDPVVQTDMTVIDLSTTLFFDTPRDGRFKLAVTILGCFGDPFSCLPGTPLGFPACSSIEYTRLVVRDPEGEIFAVMGSATR